MSAKQASGIAQRLADAQRKLMDEIRDAASYLREEHRYSLKMFATISGLHRNSMMKLVDDDWQPDIETLGKLEVIIAEAKDKKAGKPGRAERPQRGRPSEEARMQRADTRGAKRRPARSSRLSEARAS